MWTNVFEERGIKRMPFDGGFGLLAPGRIREPIFYDFAPLHCLALSRVDESPGNPMTLYKLMDSPAYPTMKQRTELNHASELTAPEVHPLKDGRFDLSLLVNRLALIEIANWN